MLKMDTQRDQTLIGVYETQAEAEAARQDLLSSGFPQAQIDISHPAKDARGVHDEDRGFWDKVKDFFSAEDFDVYEEASRQGHTLLSINIDNMAQADVDRASDIET